MDINSPYGNVNGYYNAYYPNPWWQVTGENSRQKTNNYALQGFADVAYKPVEWMNILYRVGGQARFSSYKYNRAAVTFSDYALATRGVPVILPLRCSGSMPVCRMPCR